MLVLVLVFVLVMLTLTSPLPLIFIQIGFRIGPTLRRLVLLHSSRSPRKPGVNEKIS